MNFELLSEVELKEKLTADKISGLALDIDETLSRTDVQWLNVFIDKYGGRTDMTKEEMLAEYRYIDHMPFWTQEEKDVLTKEFLYSNEFQTKIPLIENAHEQVQRINKIVPIVAYITARPVVVEFGTRSWLSMHGFPEAPMILKPVDIAHPKRNIWKAEVLRVLYPNVLGIIDDNPGLAEELRDGYKGAVFVYSALDKTTLGGGIIPCGDWDHVYEQVSKFASKALIQ